MGAILTIWAKAMCLGKITVTCPNCKQPLQLVRPDSLHPYCSLERPTENVINDDVVEQSYTCKNPSCGAKLKLYWYDTKMFLDRT